MLAALDGGRQSVLMAPTEVLAEQHLASLREDLAGLMVSDDAVLGGERPLSVQLLTGRLRAKERQAVAGGTGATVRSTSSSARTLCLTDDVRFRSSGVIVIDEQHRFGVEQRAALRDKGRERSDEGADPDLLVMTATPIPRTAAMVVFGDLDRSVLDELPQGRLPIETRGPATTWRSPRVGNECATRWRPDDAPT